MIKILNKIYNHVLEVYVFNLENKDDILITESEMKNQIFESVSEKHYHAVYDDNGDIIGFNLQES
jgi:hypothetical protein